MRKGEVRPVYLDPSDRAHLETASDLITLVSTHVGCTRGEIDDALAALVGEGTDYLLHRGLAKLLFDRCEFEGDAPCEPIELRRRVFERARQSHPVALAPGDLVHTVTRADVIAQVAGELGITLDIAERALYADLERENVLRRFDSVKPEALL